MRKDKQKQENGLQKIGMSLHDMGVPADQLHRACGDVIDRFDRRRHAARQCGRSAAAAGRP
jgi:hypothetical protein